MLTTAAPPHPFTITPLEIIPVVVVLALCVFVLALIWPIDLDPVVPVEEPPHRAALPTALPPFDWSTDETIGAS